MRRCCAARALGRPRGRRAGSADRLRSAGPSVGSSRADRLARTARQALVGAAESAGRARARSRVAAGELAAAASRRTLAAGGLAVTAVDRQARSVRRNLADARRQERRPAHQRAGRPSLARRAVTSRRWRPSERALELFRSVGDRRSEALTLNGIGLAQARTGDESGALDSYETAVALLSDLGDAHGAGRVLANPRHVAPRPRPG